MKKAAAIILAVLIMSTLMACNNQPVSTKSISNQSSAAAVTKSDLSVDEVITQIGKTVTITATQEKVGAYIGATEGKSITVNDKKFEIYKFEDKTKLEQAKTGTFSFTIQGIGTTTMNSVVNGSFAMLYSSTDDSVINAFKSVK